MYVEATDDQDAHAQLLRKLERRQRWEKQNRRNGRPRKGSSQ